MTRHATPRRFIVRKPMGMVKKRTYKRKNGPDDGMPVSARTDTAVPIQVPVQQDGEGELRNDYVNERAENTLKSLDDLLKTSAKPENVTKDADENAVYRDEDSLGDFNGVSDVHEQRELDSEIIDFERRKTEVIEEQLRMTEKEHEEEKKALERQIRELKHELHRTLPIQDNKFFSLSKQLREAITELERIAVDEGIPLDRPAPPPAPQPAVDTVSSTETLSQEPFKTTEPIQPQTPKIVTANPAGDTVQNEVQTPPEKKVLSKKKVLITGASAVAVLLLVSGGVAQIASKPKVDQKIVNQYLNNQNGKVQGLQTSASQVNSGQITANDPSQADVTFEQSEWDNFNDAGFGIMLQFPKNAVKPVKTDSNVTFIRKTGYLFKIQRIETALTLDEYWKQIKATSLSYEVSQEKFKGKEALSLELTDVADYPGDRYLVKEGNYIYDVWYATASNNFPKDDILRAQKMLDSLSIVGGKE